MLNLFKYFLLCFISTCLLSSCCQTNTKIMRGKLIMGHEVRAFVPDGQDKEFWLIDKTGNLYEEYKSTVPVNALPYTPVFAELKVIEAPKIIDGFGADYDGAYKVIDIVSVSEIK